MGMGWALDYDLLFYLYNDMYRDIAWRQGQTVEAPVSGRLVFEPHKHYTAGAPGAPRTGFAPD